MKALTLKHPWAWAICFLGKDIENRRWHPPASLIGRHFAIHGGVIPKSRYDLDDVREEAAGLAVEFGVGPEVTLADACMTGIVAVVRLAGVVTQSESTWFEGPFGWQLDDLVVLREPIACKGAQGLWDVPEEHVAGMRRQWCAVVGRTWNSRSVEAGTVRDATSKAIEGEGDKGTS